MPNENIWEVIGGGPEGGPVAENVVAQYQELPLYNPIDNEIDEIIDPADVQLNQMPVESGNAIHPGIAKIAGKWALASAPPQKKRARKTTPYKRAKTLYQETPFNKENDLELLKSGIEFKAVNIPVRIFGIVKKKGPKGNLIQIACESWKPLSPVTYDMNNDCVIIDAVDKFLLGTIEFCCEIELPGCFFKKNIPFSAAFIEKHLTLEKGIAMIKEKYPTEEFEIHYLQLHGA